jgi:hypothetical protein
VEGERPVLAEMGLVATRLPRTIRGDELLAPKDGREKDLFLDYLDMHRDNRVCGIIPSVIYMLFWKRNTV